MIPLSKLATQIARLPATPQAGRADRITDLLPDLTELAADDRIDDDSALGVLTSAIRALAPGTPRPYDRATALKQLREMLNGPPARGRGRPRIGPATEVTLRTDTYEWLDEQMRREGVTKRAEMIRLTVERAQAQSNE